MTYVVNIHEAKTHLSRLIERAVNGERVVISKAGRPVVDLAPHQEQTVVFGGLKGQLQYDDTAFDIDPEIQEMFHEDGARALDTTDNAAAPTGLTSDPVRERAA